MRGHGVGTPHAARWALEMHANKRNRHLTLSGFKLTRAFIILGATTAFLLVARRRA